MTITSSAAVLALAVVAALVLISYKIGAAKGHRRRYEEGFEAGRAEAYKLQAEDRDLAAAHQSIIERELPRQHTYYGFAAPKAKPGPRDDFEWYDNASD